MRARLALEDGTIFEGLSRGAEGEAYGEVVFNTAMTGFQEIISDPSYAGQIVTMTYPHVGNYGTTAEDDESARPCLSGLVAREISRAASNWRSERPLSEYLKGHGIVALEGIDTRALTRRIREHGAMRAVISTGDDKNDQLVRKAAGSPGLVGRDLVSDVSCAEPREYNPAAVGPLVVAFDYGMKTNILRLLGREGLRVMIVPARTSATEVLELRPSGVFLSNGPGDPAALTYAYEAIKELLGKLPIFGICLGHQLLALALGLSTFKLKFGHHGANHPVKNLATGKVEITSQNHGFAVSADKLTGKKVNGRRVALTHVNLNDGTVEGLECPELHAFSVQYHPEAAPGPHDSRYLFSKFGSMVRGD